jgi:hypothetical protein
MKKTFAIILFLSAISVNAQNVGVGVDNPLHGKLHVATTTNISQGLFGPLGTGGVSIDNNEPLIGFNLYTNSSRKYMSNGFGAILYLERTTGKLRYNVSSATGFADATVGTFNPLFAIQADGNVGIGTTSPTEARLQVHDPAGNTQFIAAAGSNLPGISAFVPTSTPSLGFNVRYQDANFKFMGPGYGGFWQFSPTTGQLQYYYSSTTGVADGNIVPQFAVAIDTNGRLGIGTSAIDAKLEVNGNFILGTGGSTLTKLIKVDVSKNLPNVPGGMSTLETFVVSGAVVGSTVYVSPESELPDNLIIAYARVSALGTVEVKFTNVSAGAINPATMDFYITVIN